MRARSCSTAKPSSFANPREAQDAGISIIFQELNLIPHLSVAENIFLGREPLTPLGLIDYRRMNRDAEPLLDRIGARRRSAHARRSAARRRSASRRNRQGDLVPTRA